MEKYDYVCVSLLIPSCPFPGFLLFCLFLVLSLVLCPRKVSLKNCLFPDRRFYMDVDAVIMNPDIRLETFVDVAGSSGDLVMTNDWNGPNSGVWLAKSTPWTIAFLRLAYAQRCCCATPVPIQPTLTKLPVSIFLPYDAHPVCCSRTLFHFPCTHTHTHALTLCFGS